MGPAVVAGLVAQVFNLLRPGRVRERVVAIRDELEALQKTDDGTSLGRAAFAVNRAEIESATINRLVPTGSPRSLGFLLLAMCSIVFVAFIASIARPQDSLENWLLWFGVLVYSIFALFSLIIGVLTGIACAQVRMMLSIGFRLADDRPERELGESFDGLRDVFRPEVDGTRNQYRFRRFYLFTLGQSSRTRLRSFVRELDRTAGDQTPHSTSGSVDGARHHSFRQFRIGRYSSLANLECPARQTSIPTME